MKYEFLYEQPRPVGYINDTVEDIHSWFLETPLELLQAKLRDSSLIELICEVIAIFEVGEPNFKILHSLFGRGLIKEVGEFQTLYKLEKVEDSKHNLCNLEMYVNNTSLMINTFCLLFKHSDLTTVITSTIEAGHGFQKKNNVWEKSVGSSCICIISINH